jgi:hypothetical protein
MLISVWIAHIFIFIFIVLPHHTPSALNTRFAKNQTDYKNQCREIASALRDKNGNIHQLLLAGMLKPADLAAMTAADMVRASFFKCIYYIVP